MTLTRNLPLVAAQSALLFLDVQNFSANRQGPISPACRKRHVSRHMAGTSRNWKAGSFPICRSCKPRAAKLGSK